MDVMRGLLTVVLCATALATSCVCRRQAADEAGPVSDNEIVIGIQVRSLGVLELLYAAHEKSLEPDAEYEELLSVPPVDWGIVRLLASQVPYHRRFFWQKAKDDFWTADFVLRVCPLVPEFQEEIRKLPPGAPTTEAIQQAWLRVLQREEPEQE